MKAIINHISGIWWSSIGSKLILQVSGSNLEGFLYSKDAPGKPARITGSIDPNPAAPNRALSFSAFWPRGRGYPATVTSYTGQFQRLGNKGRPCITTVFLLSLPTIPQNNYKAVNIGCDNFTRTRPRG